jgi:hypothetical protein
MDRLCRSIQTGATLVTFAWALAYSGAAKADILSNGEFVTYPRTPWPMNPGAALLLNDFASVCASNSGLPVAFGPGPFHRGEAI